MQNETQNTNLFDDEFGQLHYVRASTGQRFVNYLIDNLFMRFALSYITGLVVGMLLQRLAPEFWYNLDLNNPMALDILLITYAIAILNYLTYYTICERVFNGVTLGKMITRTKVIREDGAPLTWKDTFLRSLCRLVPFEPFSALGGDPWHDTWTKTAVVRQ